MPGQPVFGFFAEKKAFVACLLAALVAGTALIWWAAGRSGDQAAAAVPPGIASASSVMVTESQLATFKIAPARERLFSVEKDAIGSIDFNEDLSVQVFPSYPGKIITASVQQGQDVRKGQLLYTIQSPDLIQAESTLIGAAATLVLTNNALARAKTLLPTQGVAQKDYDQAVSDQETALGAFKAARNAVHVFGKSDAEIDRIIASRQIDPSLVVLSPITGRVTARNAQPGLLAQPGSAPAPYTVSDLSTKWMLAYVSESDSPAFHVGQQVAVSVPAYPDRLFKGRISTVGNFVDPNTHRVTLRSIIDDPNNELRPGMLANFVIETAAPIHALAIPANSIVREGDGTMTVWTTRDRRRFEKRVVSIGIRQDGYDQILSGLRVGELTVTNNAVFMSNMLEAQPSD